MKRFAIASLSILCLSLVATTSVKAETRTGHLSMVETTSGKTENANTPAFVTTSGQAETRTGHLSMVTTTAIGNTESTGITPFELVSRAYQGAYKMQGVPGFGSFLTESSSHTITAKDIIKAAIELKQLAPETQADANYISAVDVQLFRRQH
jgi:2-methylcitrate dehydratase PrpD